LAGGPGGVADRGHVLARLAAERPLRQRQRGDSDVQAEGIGNLRGAGDYLDILIIPDQFGGLCFGGLDSHQRLEQHGDYQDDDGGYVGRGGPRDNDPSVSRQSSIAPIVLMT